MSVKIITGNIFSSSCQTIVNTVNCVGVMGAGIALECRLRYPDMYQKYVGLCRQEKINVGMLWIYKSTDRWILNFPTKKHWKYPSKEEYLHGGLKKFVETFKERGVTSIAFPLLGSDKGGINPATSLQIMMMYLEDIDLDVEIYKYDPSASDDLYEKTKSKLLSQSVEEISRGSMLRKDLVLRVVDAIQSPNVTQLNQLGGVDGIGVKTLEKIFLFARGLSNSPVQPHIEQINLI